MSRCTRCSGTIIKAFEGPRCINCGRSPQPVCVSPADDGRCEGCGTLLPPGRPKPRKEPRRFCNDLCRTRTWKRKQKAA